MKPLTTILMLSALFASCHEQKKENEDKAVQEKPKVEIYLLDSSSTNGLKPYEDGFEINTNSVKIKQEPFIAYENIKYYDSLNRSFIIADSELSKFYELSEIPFAVVANKEIIYTGYFKANFSNSSCNWWVIMSDNIKTLEMINKIWKNPKTKLSKLCKAKALKQNNILNVGFGYAGFTMPSNLVDYRNDPRIIKIFKADNKIKTDTINIK